jgi:uncharacterized oligopeptide transporter (OPT) family protein
MTTGMYNVPSFTLSRLLGGLCYAIYTRREKGRRNRIILFATGLILGESLASVVNLALSAIER